MKMNCVASAALIVILLGPSVATAEPQRGTSQFVWHQDGSGLKGIEVSYRYAFDTLTGEPLVAESIAWDFSGYMNHGKSAIPTTILSTLKPVNIALVVGFKQGNSKRCTRSTTPQGLIRLAGQGHGQDLPAGLDWDSVFFDCKGERAKEFMRGGFDLEYVRITKIEWNYGLQQLRDHFQRLKEEERNAEQRKREAELADRQRRQEESNRRQQEQQERNARHNEQRTADQNRRQQDRDMQRLERERQRQLEQRERELRQKMSEDERKQYDERKKRERESRRAEKDTSKSSQSNDGGKASGVTAYDVYWMKKRAEERRRRQAQANIQQASHAVGMEIARWKPTTRQIIGTGMMFGGSAMLAAIAVPSQSETMQSVTGIFVGSTLLMANAIRIGARSKLADDPHELPGNFVTGDSHWLKTTSTMFGLSLGRVSVAYPAVDAPSDTPAMAEEVLAFGLHGVVRLSFVRLDWYTNYLTSVADGQEWRGLDTGVGLGVQPFRGGLLSPYAVYRLAFFPNNIGEEHRVYEAALAPNGSDIVVGNTFYLRGLGYKGSRGKDTLYLGAPESSRFFLDVAYTMSGRQLHEGKVLFSLGFDNAFSF